MNDRTDIVGCSYVIDGLRRELTPLQMVSALLPEPFAVEQPVGCLVDESSEPRVGEFPSGEPQSYLAGCAAVPENTVSLCFPERSAMLLVASALIDAMWREGRFKLRDLALSLSLRWHSGRMGEAAAFFNFIDSFCLFCDSLGIGLSAPPSVKPSRMLKAGVSVGLAPVPETEMIEPYRSTGPSIGKRRACPERVVPDSSSWIVFIPFDSAAPRLGGSSLAASLGFEFDVAPQTGDADYFIDCFEVVRELVEDGVVISATTVGKGGLLAALDRMCSRDSGICADISDMVGEHSEKESMRVLFSEIPGALIQIRDSDFDYLDAELLLQDVAYYPLGHPDCTSAGVRIVNTGRSGIQTILETLIQNAEGED